MASRLSIAVYRWRISCSTSTSVTRRCPDAISRPGSLVRLSCGDVLRRSSTWGYSNRRKSTAIPPLNFTQHLVHFGSGECVIRGLPNRSQFGLGFDLGPVCARFLQDSADPFAHCQAFALG